MTWRLQPSHTLDTEPDLLLALRRLDDGCVELLDRPEPLENGLPCHASQLPYYRRVLAAGLASSLSRSLTLPLPSLSRQRRQRTIRSTLLVIRSRRKFLHYSRPECYCDVMPGRLRRMREE